MEITAHYEATFAFIRPGITERDSAIHAPAVGGVGCERGVGLRRLPDRNSGPIGPWARRAGDIVLTPGHIVHIDFGVRQHAYCSDIQRVVYSPRPGDTAAPEPVRRGFGTVRAAVEAAVAVMRPGMPGHEVDGSRARWLRTQATRSTCTQPAMAWAATRTTVARCWGRYGNVTVIPRGAGWRPATSTPWSLAWWCPTTATSALRRMYR